MKKKTSWVMYLLFFVLGLNIGVYVGNPAIFCVEVDSIYLEPQHHGEFCFNTPSERMQFMNETATYYEEKYNPFGEYSSPSFVPKTI